jgi:uncharacterized repeat protein (TIGR02543 family)
MAFAAPESDETAFFSITPFEARPSGTFTTTLFLEENSNLIDFQIQLCYDTDLVSLDSVQQSEGLSGSLQIVTYEGGRVNITYTNTTSNITDRTNLVDMVFSVDGNIGIGDYPFIAFDPLYTSAEAHTMDGIDLVDLPIASEFQRLKIFKYGDVNTDGNVSIADVTYLRQYLVKMRELSELQIAQSDAYYDGVTNIFDAVMIQQSLAYELLLGNRVNITFYNRDAQKIMTKSVVVGNDLVRVPNVPLADGYSNGRWSLSRNEYEPVNFTNFQGDINVYAIYAQDASPIITWYKERLRNIYYTENTLSQDRIYEKSMSYQDGYHATIDWTSSNSATFEVTTGVFHKPTYDGTVTLTAKIFSYRENILEAEDSIDFVYNVKGVFKCPTKSEIDTYLRGFISTRIDANLDLPKKISNDDVRSSDKYEVRLTWAIVESGQEIGIDKISRGNTERTITLVATATFNGAPLEDDGKMYFDNITLGAITEREVRAYVVDQIAANTGLTLTEGTNLWSGKADSVSPDVLYQTVVRWISKNTGVGSVENNVIRINSSAVNGTALPLEAEITYPTTDGAATFRLSYTVSVATDNKLLVPGTNIDPVLYDALKTATGTYGNLTTDALKAIKFVYLDLSGYSEITDLSGLTYCANLRVLNVSGLRVTRGFNEIASLTKLEALIARDCGISTLSDGGIPVLDKLINLQMLDLSENEFTSLDSVFSPEKRYGKLLELYLDHNKLTDIDAITRAPLLRFLLLSDNMLESDDLVNFSKFKVLKFLSLADNNIDSIANLKDNRTLLELRLQGNYITNVRDLRLMTGLQALYLGRNKLFNVYSGGTEGNISFLKYLTDLEILYLNENELEDISDLNTLSKLVALNVSGNKIQSLQFLAAYGGTLEEVYAENNEISTFSFVQNLTKLTRLMLSGNMSTYESNLPGYLSGLTKLKTLTLSGKNLRTLSFLSNMVDLSRFEVADCNLASYWINSASTDGQVLNVSNFTDNISSIRALASKLMYLDVSDNGLAYDAQDINAYLSFNGQNYGSFNSITFSGGQPRHFADLYELTNLVGLYANNIDGAVNAEQLFSLMSNIRYLSLESCGITDAGWLNKFRGLVYVDIAGNNLSAFDLGGYISQRSRGTLKYLYIDSNMPCEFATAYTTYTDNVLIELSLSNIKISDIGYLPDMDSIEYLNISGSGIADLRGNSPDFYEIFTIERYPTLRTLDITGVQADISPVLNLPELETLFAIGAASDMIFYEGNLHTLYTLHGRGKTAYLYSYNEKYTPNAAREGALILGEINDVDGTEITVAARNKISDNNPDIPDLVNDFTVAWTTSNQFNYTISNNKISVNDYTDIDDETLGLTASIVVYPDQPAVYRDLDVETKILRADPQYLDVTAIGIGDDLARGDAFTYDVRIKPSETNGFSEFAEPVYTNIVYNYSAILQNGEPTPYGNILQITDENAHTYQVFADAPAEVLESLVTINVDIGHDIDGTFIVDESVSQSSRIATRTFELTFEPNGGTVTNTASGATVTTERVAETRPLLTNIAIARDGYSFNGWYSDIGLTNEFTETMMPPHNLTLYAKWQINSYTVNFETNGGSTIDSQNIAYGSLVTRPADPVRANYIFLGWYKAPVLLTQWNFGSDVVTGPTTLYAIWLLDEYTVSFNANGGTGSKAVKMTYGSKLSPPTVTRTGYTNNGWYKDSACTTAWNLNSDTVTANVTVYAKWTANNYTVTYNANGGSVSPTSKSVTYAGTYGSLPTPSRTGYDFSGWYTDASGGSKITSTTSMTTATNHTLYAHWSRIYVSVPNFSGVHIDSARSTLTSRGLKYSESWAYDYNYGNGYIRSNNYAGSSVEYGTTVTLYVSNGAKPFAVGDRVYVSNGVLHTQSNGGSTGGTRNGDFYITIINSGAAYPYAIGPNQYGATSGGVSASTVSQRTN